MEQALNSAKTGNEIHKELSQRNAISSSCRVPEAELRPAPDDRIAAVRDMGFAGLRGLALTYMWLCCATYHGYNCNVTRDLDHSGPAARAKHIHQLF